MSNRYGPWATSLDAGGNPQLSTFWRQRLKMLVPTSQSSPVLSRRQMLAIAGAGIAACSLPTICGTSIYAAPPADTDDLTVDQVLAAWKKRRESIKSFRYECQTEMTHQTFVPHKPLAQAGPPDTDERPKKFHETLSFSVSGKKMAYCSELREPDDSSTSGERVIREKAIFDGVDYTMVLDQTNPMPIGETTRDAKGGVIDGILTSHVNNVAQWLWFSPLDWLQRQGYSSDKIAIRRQHELCDGRDSALLSLTRSNPAWQTAMYVDRQRDCVPVQVTQEIEGHTSGEWSIQYVRDESVGWRVSAWEYKHFSAVGTVESRSIRGKVTQCTINKPIADDVFKIEFPEGTHVVERDRGTDKYFIVLADGKRRYIKQSEYGQIPSPEVP